MRLIATVVLVLVMSSIERTPVFAQETPQVFNLTIIPVGHVFEWKSQDLQGLYFFRATAVYNPSDPNYPGMHVIGTGYNYWDIFKTPIDFDIHVNIASAETSRFPNFLSVNPPRGVFASSSMTNKQGPFLLVFLPNLSKNK